MKKSSKYCNLCLCYFLLWTWPNNTKLHSNFPPKPELGPFETTERKPAFKVIYTKKTCSQIPRSADIPNCGVHGHPERQPPTSQNRKDPNTNSLYSSTIAKATSFCLGDKSQRTHWTAVRSQELSEAVPFLYQRLLGKRQVNLTPQGELAQGLLAVIKAPEHLRGVIVPKPT